MKLEDLRRDALVEGIEPGQPVTIRFVETIGPDACNVNYRLPSGETRERMLMRQHETSRKLAIAGRPWAFNADETVLLFSQKTGVNVTIRADIEAQAQTPFDEHILRAVRENAMALKFSPAELED